MCELLAEDAEAIVKGSEGRRHARAEERKEGGAKRGGSRGRAARGRRRLRELTAMASCIFNWSALMKHGSM